MFLAAVDKVKGIRDAGTTLKTQIRAAVDEAGVDLVVDNR